MLKKMIAPIVIGVVTVLYYLFFFMAVIFIDMVVILKLIFGIIPLLLAGAMIAVVWSRIKEITGGEEDDLSQY